MPPPQDWKWSVLTDLGRLESGHTPSRNHPEYWEGEIPWLGLRDARAHHGKTIPDTLQHINDQGIANSSARVLPAGTVCLSRTASVGYVVVMGRPMATSQDFVNWVCGPELNPQFLQYLLISEEDALLNFASGATHQTIYFPEVKAFFICHPPLPKQQRIVAILDEAFAAIATAKANTEKNLQNARGLFGSHLRSVFGDHIASPRVPIGSVSAVFDGPHATPKTVGKGPIFLGISSLADGSLDLRETRHVTQEDFVRWTRRVRPQPGDVVFSYETKLGHAAILPEGIDCCLGRRMGLVRVDRNRIDPSFFLYQYIAPPFRELLEQKTIRGATVDRIPLTDFPSFSIWAPPLAVQSQLSAEIDGIRAETQRLESVYKRKIASLDELKKSLLHQAFNGDL